jgi:hypothetical protein
MLRRSRIVVLAFSVTSAQLLCTAQAMAGDFDPFGGEPAGQERSFAADFGPTPFIPARSGESTSVVASNWAATSSSIEILPLPVEIPPVITTFETPRSGYSRGVERPPKSSF